MLENVYLQRIDEWISMLKQTDFKGMIEEIRYAEDMMFAFQDHREEQRLFKVLPKQLTKYRVEMHRLKVKIYASFLENKVVKIVRQGV